MLLNMAMSVKSAYIIFFFRPDKTSLDESAQTSGGLERTSKKQENIILGKWIQCDESTFFFCKCIYYSSQYKNHEQLIRIASLFSILIMFN
jgi:hypothetical protein